MSRTISTAIASELAKTTGDVHPRTLFLIYLDAVTLYFTNHDHDITFQGQTFSSRRCSHTAIKTYLETKTDNTTMRFDNVDQLFSDYFSYVTFEGRKAEIWKIFMNTATAAQNGSVIKTATTIPYDGLTGTFPASGTAYIATEKFTYTGNTGSALTGCSARSNAYLDGAVILCEYPIDGYPTTNDKILLFKGFMDIPVLNEMSAEIKIVNLFDRSQSSFPWRRYSTRCNWKFCSADCTYRGSVQPRGTATSGTTTTLTATQLVGGSSLVGGTLRIMDGAGFGEESRISAHNTGTGQITFPAVPVAINNTSVFVIECDKSQGTCSGFSNLANFGGFSEKRSTSQVKITDLAVPTYPISIGGTGAPPQTVTASPATMIISDDTPLPIVYGTGHLSGKLVASGNVITTINNVGVTYKQTRIYAYCSGEVNSILSNYVSGVSAGSTNSIMFQKRLGGASESLQSSNFHPSDAWQLTAGKTYYFKNTAYVAMKSTLFISDGGNVPLDTWYYANLFSTSESDTVTGVIQGLKILQYDSGGNVANGGATVWDDNPAWCLLDFITHRCMSPINTANIDLVSFYNAAVVCDTNKYRLNLVITDTAKETEIINNILATCRGYLSYFGGKMYLNIEQVLGGSVAHYFDDGTNGKTADNIVKGSFSFGKNNVNETPNRVIVTYIDEQIREHSALLNGYLVASNTTINYKDNLSPVNEVVYINGELINYNGNTGTALTGCWARTKDYPSGYPMFWGAQLFPAMTAIYNDYDAQESSGRVIELAIDGKGIPSYEQAYSIASFYGKKSVYGNLQAHLTGMMDSLKLTVGDIVDVSHDLPGWVDKQFRITAVSETMDEEVAYDLDFYSPYFYGGVSSTPPNPTESTLPNPFGPVGPATSLSVSELQGAYFNGSYKAILNFTYALPIDPVFWDSGHIYIKRPSDTIWTSMGYDYSGGTGFKIETGFIIGELVSIKVVSVKIDFTEADFFSSPTLDFTPTNVFVAAVKDIWQEVIDNNVQLGWTGVQGRYPIALYEVRKGDIYSTAEIYGTTNSTFKTYFETMSGTYKYWITPIDTNGVYGTPDSITAIVNQPPDFVLHTQFDDFFAGTKVNIIYDSGDDTFYACANTTQTFDAYCATLGGTTMADFVSAATYMIEPMATSASYEQVYDCGALVTYSTIYVALDKAFLRGSATIVCTISVSATGAGGSWTDDADVWKSLGTNFRYIKVHLDFTATATDIILLNNLNIVAKVKEQSESGKGTITNAASGLVITFEKVWSDINYIKPEPFGSSASWGNVAIADFVDVPNPTTATFYMFNSYGTKIMGDICWTIRGV